MEKSLFRKLLNLAVVLLIAHAGWKVGPVFFRHYTFQDKVTEAARFSERGSAADLKKTILAIADSERVPLDPKALDVLKSGGRIRITASYTENLEILPRYYYPHEFEVSITTALARPMAPGEIR